MLSFFSTKKFSDPLNTAVFTTVYVMKESATITLVSHEIDGAWQFMGSQEVTDYTKVAMVVGLGEMIKHDKTVLQVADLPKGYQATRQSKKDKWTIVKIEYSDEEIREMGFLCAQCGEFHKDVPMAYGADAPYDFFQIPKDQVEASCQLTQDCCIIDEEKFFVKGQITIAVDDNEEFRWTVWARISENDFQKIQESWTDENRILEEPYQGYLATQLSCYADTLNLPLKVRSQKVGIIPKIEIIDTSHPLFLEQESGINMERVISFAKQLIYNH
jgi:hypothetical protein